MYRKRPTLMLLLVGILFTGCKKREPTKAEHRHQSITQSEEAITLTEEKLFDFTTVDTSSYYIGEVDDNTYLFKVDHLKSKGIIGHYYAVNEQAEAEPQRFEIEYKQGDYLFCTSDKDIEVSFNISIDTASVDGTISSGFMGMEKRTLSFEKYRIPQYMVPTSPRYHVTDERDYLHFTIDKNVVYGHAPGYWSSNPTNDDTKYLRIIMNGMAKTIKERDIEIAMDIYLPEDRCNKRPLLVLLHGGAFYIGDKGVETMTTWCEHFAKSGYVVASINYRMGFRVNKASIQKCGYAAMQDAHAAIRYLVAHADQYGIDPNNIFLGGTSAGAITAMGVAFWDNSHLPDFAKENGLIQKMGPLDASTNHYSNKFKIRALANMWGAVYDLDVLNGNKIPVVSFHGTKDNLVPYDKGIPFADVKGKFGEKLFDTMYGSKSIHKRLDSLHVRNKFYPLEGASHAPYQDKHGHPNQIYFFIQDHMQEFFYQELARVGEIRQSKQNPQQYTLHQDDVTSICWKATGGFILDAEDRSVHVLWRKDAPIKELSAAGMRENLCPFEKSLKL